MCVGHRGRFQVHARSVRNCPWVAALWHEYIVSLERLQQPDDAYDAVFNSALAVGFQVRQLQHTRTQQLTAHPRWPMSRNCGNTGATERCAESMARFVSEQGVLSADFCLVLASLRPWLLGLIH